MPSPWSSWNTLNRLKETKTLHLN